jgi:hypothetical protein
MEDVVIESGPKRREFARAVERPGWCRSRRDEKAALAALEACRDRYATVVARSFEPGGMGNGWRLGTISV